MKKALFTHTYKEVIALENLLEAWREFVKGKRSRKDVQEFERNLMGGVVSLHQDLATLIYQHGGYQEFRISDPKPRKIHKATVRDRLVHRALYRSLYQFFERIFIVDSFSCRLRKGTHGAMSRFKRFTYPVSHNNTRTVWILKCDIRKFFASIDQRILGQILGGRIQDKNIVWLLEKIIASFYTDRPGIGLPLGNLTSQLFANIYMNRFDQFVKHDLKVEYYVRYTDDFVLLSSDKLYLERALTRIRDFLRGELRLELHPDKVFIKTLASGVDFLGWVHFPDHRVLRTATKRRMMRRILESPTTETVQSYLGLLEHGNTFGVRQEVVQKYWLCQ